MTRKNVPGEKCLDKNVGMFHEALVRMMHYARCDCGPGRSVLLLRNVRDDLGRIGMGLAYLKDICKELIFDSRDVHTGMLDMDVDYREPSINIRMPLPEDLGVCDRLRFLPDAVCAYTNTESPDEDFVALASDVAAHKYDDGRLSESRTYFFDRHAYTVFGNAVIHPMGSVYSIDQRALREILAAGCVP